MDVVGTGIILGLCLGFGLAALGLAVAGVFINASRAAAELAFKILQGSASAIFPLLLRALRPLLLTASVMCFTVFLLFALSIRQAYFLDEALVEAAGHGDLPNVRILLDRGASPDAYGFDSTTALV
jgi:hypothetical protein